MNNDSAHKHGWETGEFFLGIPYLIGITIQIFYPATITQEKFILISLIAGILLIVIGFGFLVLTRRQFAAFNQPTDPGQPTCKIMTSGIFSISRNPLYMGGILILAGISLTLNLLWPMLMMVLSVILCHYFLILPEEKYLAKKFGEEYKAYTASVRRWLGKK
ncbi:MAG: isoprenylcysteine carboxylmethyltransferase family protein [Anaerolineaceae bacterium]|nr:isoprenylcysteine carboxylmethyltransferase family protein [Anaerolineaceae bacterium]